MSNQVGPRPGDDDVFDSFPEACAFRDCRGVGHSPVAGRLVCLTCFSKLCRALHSHGTRCTVACDRWRAVGAATRSS